MSSKHGPDDPTAPALLEATTGLAAARVVVLWDGGSASRWMAPDATIVLGRSDECDLQIEHSSVSRRHARISSSVPIVIEDLHSSNGVRVRGEPIEPGRPV